MSIPCPHPAPPTPDTRHPAPLGSELRLAEEAVLAAGAVLKEMRCGTLHVREKPDRSLVTEADLAAESEILSRIRRA
ncbi:MAG TPA: hypothetical protein VFU47_15155, partial [Armatimonadota bacterium]|nr:hypothetical protein [Armatimonadota bacterium]